MVRVYRVGLRTVANDYPRAPLDSPACAGSAGSACTLTGDLCKVLSACFPISPAPLLGEIDQKLAGAAGRFLLLGFRQAVLRGRMEAVPPYGLQLLRAEPPTHQRAGKRCLSGNHACL